MGIFVAISKFSLSIAKCGPKMRSFSSDKQLDKINLKMNSKFLELSKMIELGSGKGLCLTIYGL